MANIHNEFPAGWGISDFIKRIAKRWQITNAGMVRIPDTSGTVPSPVLCLKPSCIRG
jgi:hypothetical protein